VSRAGIEWFARYGGNDAKCGDTEGPFIYMGKPCFRWGDEREMGREREKEKETEWAHRWPLESGHAVTGRKRPLLAMPRSSLQLCYSLAKYNEEVEELTHSDGFLRILFCKNVFIKKLFSNTSLSPINDLMMYSISIIFDRYVASFDLLMLIFKIYVWEDIHVHEKIEKWMQ